MPEKGIRNNEKEEDCKLGETNIIFTCNLEKEILDSSEEDPAGNLRIAVAEHIMQMNEQPLYLYSLQLAQGLGLAEFIAQEAFCVHCADNPAFATWMLF
jgi:hypothetical protein